MSQMTFGVLRMTPKEFRERLDISDDEMWALTQQFQVEPERLAAAQREITTHRDTAHMWKKDYWKLWTPAWNMVMAVVNAHSLHARHALEDYDGDDKIVHAAQKLDEVLNS